MIWVISKVEIPNSGTSLWTWNYPCCFIAYPSYNIKSDTSIVLCAHYEKCLTSNMLQSWTKCVILLYRESCKKSWDYGSYRDYFSLRRHMNAATRSLRSYKIIKFYCSARFAPIRPLIPQLQYIFSVDMTKQKLNV